MANANIIELETCVSDCLRAFQANPDAEFTRIYLEPLLKVQRRWQNSVALSEKHHLRWRAEERDELVSFKHLANALREAQIQLRRIGAIDFPESRVMYWDQELLLSAVAQMREYFEEHREQIEFAGEFLDRFERLQSGALSESRDVGAALKEFQRFVDMRRESLHEVTALLTEIRIGMRRILGKKHPVYTGVRWPYALATDEGVLF